MAKKTKISWCDSTFNPFIGCTKVGPGCDHCYAEVQDSRKRWGGTTHWGAGVARYRTSESNWKQPLLWDRHAQNGLLPDGKTPSCGRSPRVFSASLADVFDNEVPQEWRNDLWKLIEATPHLSWLLVTKRIGNVDRMFPQRWFSNMRSGIPTNVRTLITVCNQEEADRDIPKLLALPCRNGISYEPALGPIDLSRWIFPPGPGNTDRHGFELGGFHSPIQWVIVGGESGSEARPFDHAWARRTIDQGNAAGVPVFIKQLGTMQTIDGRTSSPPYGTKDRAGADPAEWPEDLRVRQFPLSTLSHEKA